MRKEKNFLSKVRLKIFFSDNHYKAIYQSAQGVPAEESIGSHGRRQQVASFWYTKVFLALN